MKQESKKLALLRVLDILKRYSDQNHPLTQDKIVERLKKLYHIDVDRRTVSRQISLLLEAFDGIDSPISIVTDRRRGVYIEEREFEDSELRLLIDGVLSSRHVSPNHSKDLIEKLCAQATEYFKPRVKNVYSVNDWNKTDNPSVFLNIDLIDEAIERGLQLKFVYNKYGIDKKLCKTSNPRVSPYQLILHNQKYYLMALHEGFKDMHFYRVDRITDLRILEDKTLTDIRTVPGYSGGIDYKKISSGLPYMFTDRLEHIVILVEPWALDDVIDWFGKDVRIESFSDKYKVTLYASPLATEYWALQYLSAVEVLTPDTLRASIKKALQDGVKKYS